jgi:D-lactate dehydrogenase
MKPGVMLINTSRGAVIDTRALIASLKAGHIGSVGLDVYEEEGDLFFKDLSDQVIQDDVFARLMTFPNVFITAHQGFFTREFTLAQNVLQQLDLQVGFPLMVDFTIVTSLADFMLAMT